jgi:hypothetical protein
MWGIADVSAEIGNEHLPNKREELYSCANRFGGFNEAVYKALLHFLNFCAVTCRYADLRKTLRELDRPSESRLSAKLVPTFADRGCRMVSATDSHSR